MSINFNEYPPKEILEKYKVYVAFDPPFRSWCRLKQSMYREQHGWDAGIGGRDKREIGNYLAPMYANRGRNFLSNDIYINALDRLQKREPKDVIHKDRLMRNMLTSQTLCFNFFIPQILDREMATAIWNFLIPNRVANITNILLEHSPARGNTVLGSGDHSAFDAYLEYEHQDGSYGILAVETKYTEPFSKPRGEPSQRHLDIALKAGIYSESGWERMKSMKTQQLWRTHLLAESMRNSHVMHVTYLVLYAEGDRECAQLIGEYRDSLNKQLRSEEVFVAMTLENVFATLRTNDIQKDMFWLDLFYQRYLDWSQVEQLL